MKFEPAAVDWADPSPFYLVEPDLAPPHDVVIKHSGLELPAHRLTLAQSKEGFVQWGWRRWRRRRPVGASACACSCRALLPGLPQQTP